MFIENYRVALIREDNELFNKYQGAINNHANDIRATQKKEEDALKLCAADDTSDIKRKIWQDEFKPNDVLMAEYEPCRDPVEHIVTSGKTNVDTPSEKQEWSKQIVFSFVHCFKILIWHKLYFIIIRTQALRLYVHVAYST